ncbi:CDP-diacylglycerol--glycerol-3-phosphate 3-phosphatidyltransferase 2 [Manihot esculenta]|uniref:CDP-diacylglycerol--glycerol-3-phosphate 1-phosphatidyltransferase n=1 Tax=Manihot esculenta TaxID=3983 RepID=A0A2C9V338_MANES|nr:CDP-diacylglycerol--glycerol-3-phosphate 3-phosphatidyltransferase 2 [Manihot esculenta]OAY38749.1 hypothetical protein MANES_10G040100v8 [Manihot esculenta]
MAVLKLTTTVSFCGKPSKWARNATRTSSSTSATITTTTTAAAPFATLYTYSPSLSLALNSHRSDWRRLTPCASFASNSSCYNSNDNNLLGFAFSGQKHFSLFHCHCSSSSSSAPKTGGFSGSDSSSTGSGLADMGSENKVDVVDWHQNNHLNGRNHPLSASPSRSPSLQNCHKQQDSYYKLLTLPTILTLGRVAAVPLLVSTFYVDSWWGRTATTTIFIAAAVTDWLDGYLARKMKLGSAFGAFLDPVADKLMVAATLVLLCTRPLEVAMFGQASSLLTVPSIAIIGREITMSAVREWAASQNSKLLEAVAVNNLGKWKTATQMTALTILLATRDGSVGGPGILATSGVVLLYISGGLSLWSLAVYTSKIWKVLVK